MRQSRGPSEAENFYRIKNERRKTPVCNHTLRHRPVHKCLNDAVQAEIRQNPRHDTDHRKQHGKRQFSSSPLRVGEHNRKPSLFFCFIYFFHINLLSLMPPGAAVLLPGPPFPFPCPRHLPGIRLYRIAFRYSTGDICITLLNAMANLLGLS